MNLETQEANVVVLSRVPEEKRESLISLNPIDPLAHEQSLITEDELAESTETFPANLQQHQQAWNEALGLQQNEMEQDGDEDEDEDDNGNGIDADTDADADADQENEENKELERTGEPFEVLDVLFFHLHTRSIIYRFPFCSIRRMTLPDATTLLASYLCGCVFGLVEIQA